MARLSIHSKNCCTEVDSYSFQFSVFSSRFSVLSLLIRPPFVRDKPPADQHTRPEQESETTRQFGSEWCRSVDVPCSHRPVRCQMKGERVDARQGHQDELRPEEALAVVPQGVAVEQHDAGK